ncbi:DUF5615 family PIN-like protein [Crocosphaera sp.]|uniref:DUF5615 family PIN-like protein n=1 Tax=Crocosphaera sp. TaxID=2729996 RepID=UPI002622973F|nr:DUF5615 family PIN-like protein [Crocosphaera sp.]MDJ0579831.1 DUF5615 family PIN-like protein [Crocosphaera sp.]
MSKLKLHLDADTSIKALQNALINKGYDVTRTPTDWMALDASDDVQLLGATAQERCIFTFNIRDFLILGERYKNHYGIILAAQSSWNLSSLIAALSKMLSETEAEELQGQIRWLNQWKC